MWSSELLISRDEIHLDLVEPNRLHLRSFPHKIVNYQRRLPQKTVLEEWFADHNEMQFSEDWFFACVIQFTIEILQNYQPVYMSQMSSSFC